MDDIEYISDVMEDAEAMYADAMYVSEEDWDWLLDCLADDDLSWMFQLNLDDPMYSDRNYNGGYDE